MTPGGTGVIHVINIWVQERPPAAKFARTAVSYRRCSTIYPTRDGAVFMEIASSRHGVTRNDRINDVMENLTAYRMYIRRPKAAAISQIPRAG